MALEYLAVDDHKVASQAMTWKGYALHMLATNLVMALFIFAILSFCRSTSWASRGWRPFKHSHGGEHHHQHQLAELRR